tara:strand:- start:664 stop:1785 length:1122 start_codon:yes stop_codon:yes gene_type:complete
MKLSKLKNIIKEQLTLLKEQQGTFDPNTGSCGVGGGYCGTCNPTGVLNMMPPCTMMNLFSPWGPGQTWCDGGALIKARICIPQTSNPIHYTGTLTRRISINGQTPVLGQRFCSPEAIDDGSGGWYYGQNNVAWVVETIITDFSGNPNQIKGCFQRPELPGLGACTNDPDPCYNFWTWGTTMDQYQCCYKCATGSTTPGTPCDGFCECCDILFTGLAGCADPNASNYSGYGVACNGIFVGTWPPPNYGDTSCCTYPVSYDCDSNGNCFDPGTGQGQYPTQAACLNSCTPPPLCKKCCCEPDLIQGTKCQPNTQIMLAPNSNPCTCPSHLIECPPPTTGGPDPIDDADPLPIAPSPEDRLGPDLEKASEDLGYTS